MGRPESVESALGEVRGLYTEGLREHGAASKAVGWRDEESQRLRFDKLAAVLDAGGGPVSVGDFGCGYGAMFGYLADRLGERLAAYEGCDISEEMIAAARASTTDPRARFTLGDRLPEVDYAFVSGTFNVRFEAPDDEWLAYVQSTLRTLAGLARHGIAFNLLSTYVDWQEPHLFYGDPLGFFDFCKRELSPRVSLLHDYPLYEWTILARFE